MLNKLMTSTALALLLATTPALAQSTTEPTTNEATQGESYNPAASENATEPEAPAAQAPKVDEPVVVNDEDKSTRDAAMNDANVQAEGTWLASALIGRSAYNGNDEAVGDINDLVIGADGNVKTVVIGVGGFLGIGEKDVGIEFDRLQLINNNAEGEPRLLVDATKEELENAPAFVTAASKRVIDEADALRQRQLDGMNKTVDPADPQAQPKQQTE